MQKPLFPTNGAVTVKSVALGSGNPEAHSTTVTATFIGRSFVSARCHVYGALDVLRIQLHHLPSSEGTNGAPEVVR